MNSFNEIDGVPAVTSTVMSTDVSNWIWIGNPSELGPHHPSALSAVAEETVGRSVELIPSNSQLSITSSSNGIEVLESEFLYQEEIESGEQFSALIPISIAEEPLLCVVMGTGRALEEKSKLSDIFDTD